MITEKQREYIGILSNYTDTKEKDANDIQNFLLQHRKARVEDLSKTEASELIQILLKCPVKYIFKCKKEIIISKSDYNRYHVIGELEACLHECDPYNDTCPIWSNAQ